MRLGCFNQSLQSSITILKIAHFYLMPNKPNLMTVLLKNPKLVETKKVGFFFCPKKLAIMKLGLYFHLVIFPLPVVKMMLMLYFCNKTHVSCIINRYTMGLSHLAKHGHMINHCEITIVYNIGIWREDFLLLHLSFDIIASCI